MTTGGYKCVSFSWQGGRTDSAVDRVKFILNGLCDAIVGANVGWAYDTLTPTSTDFLTMPSSNSTYSPNLVKLLKMEYNSHTYRLAIGYTYSALSSSHCLKPSDVCNTYASSGFSELGYFDGCLYFSIIKDGILIPDATYGYVWDGNGQFLKWMPFAMTHGNSASCASSNTNGAVYTYYAILKNAQIAILFRNSEWGTSNGSDLKCIVAGEVFKETGHASDTNTFNAIGLSNLNSYDKSIVSGTARIYVNAAAGTVNLNNSAAEQTASQIISANGTVYSNAFGSYLWKSAVYFDSGVISDVVSSVVTSPGGRWTPVWMFIRSSDHDTYGVVPGDGFKGYLDTDLIRGVNPNYSYGQQLDNGKFVYLGGGFAIGWDPNNTTLLF